MTEEKATRILKCKLTALEVEERAQDLAKAEIYRDQCENELAAEAEAWKERKKEMDARVLTAAVNCTRLARVVHDHEEDRAVECIVEIRPPNYSLIRTDTGEVVVFRPATQEELQRTLDLSFEPPVDAEDPDPPFGPTS